MNPINEFQGAYRFLSNFWPCYLEYENVLYPSAEHAYQAAKLSDISVKGKISECATPADAKDFFQLKNIMPDIEWTVDRKLRVMEEILDIKFGGKNPLLTRALLATGDAALIEGNDWNDEFWGVCNGRGENHLGKLLMKIRARLLHQKEQLLAALATHQNNAAVAEQLSISERDLYEKLIVFAIPNNEYWIR